MQGNAEKSRIIMVGDTLKKASESSGGKLIEIKDFGDTEYGMHVSFHNHLTLIEHHFVFTGMGVNGTKPIFCCI